MHRVHCRPYNAQAYHAEYMCVYVFVRARARTHTFAYIFIYLYLFFSTKMFCPRVLHHEPFKTWRLLEIKCRGCDNLRVISGYAITVTEVPFKKHSYANI